MKHTENKKRDTVYIVLLALIIVIQCVFYTFIFMEKKTGYHEDEYFSYALSNSYKRPFLYGSDLQQYDNYDVWMTGEEFRDYLFPNENTKFAYDSVWWNQATDTNPPFYYAVLHTISSVFSGKFSWWYAYSINLLCFAVSQIFLYLLAIQLSRSKVTALIVCAFRGFTIAAQGDTLFLRMYCMLTMFGIMYAYYSLKILLAEKQHFGNMIACAAVAFFGAMTQHLFLIYAFLLTAFVCLFLLAQKKWKTLFSYGCSAAVGVLLSFAAFPAAYQHLFHSRLQFTETPEITQVAVLINLILTSVFGIKYYTVVDILFTLKVILIFIVPICLPVLFLFRKQLPAVGRKVLEFCKKTLSRSVKYLRQNEILLVTCILFLFIVSARFYYFDLMEDSIRYVFLIVPLLIAVIICGCSLIVKAVNSKIARRIIYGILTGGLVFSLIWQNCQYEPRYIIQADPENGRISEYTKDMDCILLPYTAIYMPIYSQMFAESNDVYETLLLDDQYRLEHNEAEYQKLFNKKQPFMLVFDGSPLFDEEFYESLDEDETGMNQILIKKNGMNWTKERVVGYFEELSGYTAEFCTAETSHYNRIYVYRMIPNET